MKNFLNKHYKIICISMIFISLFLSGLCYYNDKININTASSNNIEYICNNVDGIGIQTATKLIDSKPFNDIKDVSKINGIGETKYKIISEHFCVYDTWRFVWLIFIQIIGIIIGIIGILILIYKANKQRYKDELDNRQRQAIIDSINKVGKCNYKNIK